MSGEAPVQLTEQERACFAWLEQSPLRKVIKALEEEKAGCARFVGGCVRDSLLGVAPKDFDVATILEPPQVLHALESAGLGAVPTGIEHGTVTAIADHQGVEITSLRADVATDGRRATVAYTQDWSVDAQRRDFTINAIYLDPAGFLYDPVGGIADLEARQVCFIGDAGQRLHEDYLRILRFFRFTARISDRFDPDGLAACKKYKAGINGLSAERIGAEFMQILSLPRAAFALNEMQASGVLEMIWDSNANIEALERLKKVSPKSSAPVLLAALFGEGEGLGARLRLSNAEKSIRTRTLAGVSQITQQLDGRALRAVIYRLGRDVFFDAAAAAFAFGNIDSNGFTRMTRFAESWTPPVMQVSGRDILKAGAPQGPLISKILAVVEEQWVSEDFPEENRLHEILREKTIAAIK